MNPSEEFSRFERFMNNELVEKVNGWRESQVSQFWLRVEQGRKILISFSEYHTHWRLGESMILWHFLIPKIRLIP